MRTRFIVLAAGLAAAAVLVALLVLNRHRAHPPPVRLVAFAPAQITRIDAQGAGWPNLALVRRDGTWTMHAPVRAPADASRIAALISALEEPVARKYPADAVNIATTGLEQPALKVSVNGNSLAFGVVNPVTLLRYVRSGDGVASVMDYVAPMLQNGPWQFVDPHLLPSDAVIEKIELPARTLSRKNGSWRLTSAPPGAQNANAAKLASAWLHACANAVLPLKQTPDTKAGSIRVRLAGRGAPIVFVPVPESNGTGLARPDIGIVYVFGSATARELLVGPLAQTSDAGTAGS